MKKFSLILAALLTVFSVYATDYEGTVTVKTISSETTRDGMTLHVEENENGTFNASMSFAFNLLGQTIDVTDVDFENMLGVTTSDGYTTITGTKQLSLLSMSGLDNIIPSWLQGYIGNTFDKTVPIAFTARFNGTYATAALSFNLQLSITIPIIGNTVEIVNTPVLVAFEKLDPNPGSGIKGDVDGNGSVGIEDVNEVINIMLAQ